MSKYLVIVESPSKCGKLQKILGSDYKIIASVGHIMEIPKKGLGIDIANGFEPHYEISQSRKDVVKQIKSDSVKTDDTIYLATDPDREGHAIAFGIYNLLDSKSKKKCLRITFTEITKNAVLKSIKDAKKIEEYATHINAQKARQVLDRLIGYKISPLLWENIADKTSAGRVQSVALKFICEREKEIASFKPESFWYVDANLICKKGEFVARVVTPDKDNRFLKEVDATSAYDALNKADYSVKNVEIKDKEVKPNPPFDTASLQTSCSSIFGWPVTKTSSVAQSLYTSGHVSYIRTDSYNISDEAMTEVRNLIKSNHSGEYLPKSANVYLQKADASSQEAHECIRPTHCEYTGGDLPSDEKRLYELIRARFIACQMTPAIMSVVTYSIKTNTKYNLIAQGQTVKFDGWMKEYRYKTTNEEILPYVEVGEVLKLKKLDKTKHETKPPPRYNGGSLVALMKKNGVGRPATYASIVENIKNRGYVEEIKAKKGAFQATPLGLKVFEYLQQHFSEFIMDVKFTAVLEEDLDIIESGKKKFIEVVSSTYETMKGQIEKASGSKQPSDSEHKCTVCKEGNIVKRRGKFGFFFSCDKYPTCKSVYELKEGNFTLKEKKEYTSKEAPKDTGVKCSKCKKGTIRQITGKFGVFFGCSNYPKCRAIFIKNDNGKFEVKSSKGFIVEDDSKEDQNDQNDQNEEGEV